MCTHCLQQHLCMPHLFRQNPVLRVLFLSKEHIRTIAMTTQPFITHFKECVYEGILDHLPKREKNKQSLSSSVRCLACLDLSKVTDGVMVIMALVLSGRLNVISFDLEYAMSHFVGCL